MIELRVLGTPEVVDDHGRSVTEVVRQPKRLALLAYLALASHRGFCRRDVVLALLWPDSSQERARGALRQATYHLRKALGPDVVVTRGDGDLGLAPGRVACDAVEVARLLAEGRREEALALHQGELLPGLYVADAPGFERWLDERRAALRGAAGAAALGLARERAAESRAGDAAEWARRAVSLLPWEDEPVRLLMESLRDSGDLGGALRAFRDHERALRDDLESEPSAAIVALAAAIREELTRLAPEPSIRVAPARPHAFVPPAPPDPGPSPSPSASPPARISRVATARLGVAAVAALVVAVVAFGPGGFTGGLPSATPVRIAVTRLSDHAPGQAGAVPASTLRDMLAVSLARVPGLEVVSSARLYELARDLGADGTTDTPASREDDPDLIGAARHASVREALEGDLYRLPDGTWRLELVRTEPDGGRVLGALRVEGRDPYALVDRATAEYASIQGVAAPRLGIADVTTSSVVAYRFYEEGLRAYYLGDRRGAGRLFLAALAEDSTFAMASYYASMSVADAHRSLLARALRFAENASDRERLVIRAAWTAAHDDAARLAVAETLAIRYPAEPDGHLWRGRAALADGRFLDAVTAFERVVVMDSSSLGGLQARCRACEALADLGTAYLYADSLPAAERVARRWVRAQPASPEPWASLFFVTEARGDLEEALAALDSVAVRASDHWVLGLRGGVFLRRGDFAAADRFLLERMRNGDRAGVENALWGLTISLRHQGRYAEAMELARRYRWWGGAPGTSPRSTLHRAAAELSVLQDMGRHREALALADSIARAPFTGESASRDARATVWALTQGARSAAALGDTAWLRTTADTVRVLGARSGYARDRRLHHHVRGLLLRRRGDPAAAAAELRRAVYSLRGGYVRTNVELGRALLEAGDPSAAVPVLEAALAGPIGADGMWSTKTEIRHLLRAARLALGDSAAAGRHAAWIAAATAAADRPSP